VPVVIVALILGQIFVPTSRDPAAPPVDAPGAVLSITGLVALVWAIIEGPNGWTDPAVIGAFVLAAVLLGAFYLWERHTRTPMLDMNFFRNPRFSAASGSLMLTFFAMFGSLFLLTQYLQSVLGYSALEAGVRLIPMAATQMVVAPLSAKIVERVGSKIVVAAGLLTGAAGLAIASRLTPGSTYPEILVALIVLAIGIALVMPPATESIMGSLPLAKAGVGSAVNDTTRQVGGALGVAVLGSVMMSTYRPRVSDAIAGLPLPAEAANAVTDQVGAAVRVGERLGPAGAGLVDAASNGFTDGMAVAFLIGTVALLIGAIIVALYLPARAHDHEVEEPAAAPSPAPAPASMSAPVSVSGDGNGSDAPVDAPVDAPASGDAAAEVR
jgi:Na+/melibiose symporter-like transporter